jgi:hypothetical protein
MPMPLFMQLALPSEQPYGMQAWNGDTRWEMESVHAHQNAAANAWIRACGGGWGLPSTPERLRVLPTSIQPDTKPMLATIFKVLHAAQHSQIYCQADDLPFARLPDVASKLWFRNLLQDCKATNERTLPCQ